MNKETETAIKELRVCGQRYVIHLQEGKIKKVFASDEDITSALTTHDFELIKRELEQDHH